MKYIIIKSSRPGFTPYAGPSCEKAGVEPGKFYLTEWAAFVDAEKLSRANAVGFKVKPFAETYEERCRE